MFEHEQNVDTEAGFVINRDIYGEVVVCYERYLYKEFAFFL